MSGSLALHRGSLFIGREEKTASVRVFDLDGRERSSGFSFRDHRAGRSTAAGLAVDDDRRIWVADTPCSRVRCFSLFGREETGFGLALDEPLLTPPFTDARGELVAPVDVAVRGDSEGGTLVIANGGECRHAVQVFDVEAGYVFSPAPGGDPHGRFRGVRGVAMLGRFLYVADAIGGRVHVFRDDAFHFAFEVFAAGNARFEPFAVAPLADGRMVVACAGETSALLLLDGAGNLVRVLAEGGEGEGAVRHPRDVVVESAPDAHARIAVIDRDGERVQIFTLQGRCYGAFAARA